MKKKIIASVIAATAISVYSFADYKVKVFLEPNFINVNIPDEINGDSNINPSTINRGESSMLSWSYDLVSTVDISGDTTFSTNDREGSIPLSPLKTSNYQVTVDNGKVQYTKDLKLTVIQPDPTLTFTSDKLKIGEGQSAKLSWNTTNTESAVLNNGIGSVGLNASTDVYPLNDTTYTLKAIGYNQEKETSKSITIDVIKNSLINSFTVDKNKFTVGESAIFNWNVNDSEALVLSPYGNLNKDSNSQVVPLNSVGEFDYTLTTTSFNNSQTSSTLKLNVYGEPAISSYTVNDQKTVNVESGDDLVFKWQQANADSITLDNTIVNGTSTTLKAPSTTKNYILEVQNGAGKKVQDTVAVNIIAPVAINSITAPTPVFANTPFTMNWTGSSVEKYELSGTTGSGVGTSENLDKNVTKIITPTTAGSYVYTLKATSLADKSIEQTKSVVVESDPSFTGFTVNGQSAISVSPSASLTFAAVGQSSGSTLQGRNSGNTANADLPATAPVSAGSYTYYGSVTKTLNSISRYSANRSVTVTVVSAPTITNVTAPSNVFANAGFTLNWSGTDVTNYKIKSNNANSGVSLTDVDLGSSVTMNITPISAGTYTYTITGTNAAGVTTTSTKSVVVEADPSFTGYTVNGASSITVAPSTALTYASTGNSSGSSTVGRNSTNTSDVTNPATASSTAGTYTYYGASSKTLNSVTRYSAVRSVTVTVVNAPSISSVTAPTNVFANTGFTMSWTGSNVTNYKIKSNNAASGIAVSDVDLGTATSSVITPTSAGSYTYTITATNAAGVTTTSTKTVTVETDPTFTGFTVNGSSSVTVAPSVALSYAITGNSTGSSLIGRNSGNTADATNPTTSPASAGSYTYYGAVSKTLNSVTRYSAVRSVAVTVVNNPTVGTITAPTNVFANTAFTMSWSGSNITSYSIKSNNASSGIATTDVNLNTVTSTTITPTAAGTYTYTITGTNAAGVTVTNTKSVIVEADPTFTGFTVNSATSVSVAPSATLTFVGTGYSSGASLDGRNSANTASATLPTAASASAGTTTYYASATKTLNGITRVSAVRTVAVTVVASPSISAVNAPTNVFTNAAFTMSWTASGATNYKIRANNATSGIATTDVDLGTTASRAITPTAAGTYTYTITATNSIGTTTTTTKSVIVEADPSFTGFTVNAAASVSVSPSAALTFAGSGYSSGATLAGRNSANSAAATLPTAASASAGTTTYYAAATKTLNGVARFSPVRSVSVTVVANPVINTHTAPTSASANVAFSMSWAATGATSYKLRSNNASSGIATTDVALGTATSRSITPTAAGTYTYVLTATNSLGVTTTSSKSVTVSGAECRAATSTNQWSYYESGDESGSYYSLTVLWDGAYVWQADTPIPEGSFTRNGYKYSIWKASTVNTAYGPIYGVCRQ